VTETQPQAALEYDRVSTHWQMLDARLKQLGGEGSKKIYRNKGDRCAQHRRELLKCSMPSPPGDVVTVARIDRLARQRDASR
jgi:DNA invertase Pin-like site-specific DNA recombinase